MKFKFSLTFVVIFAFVIQGWSQSRTVSGIVTSSDDGEPLIGVSILVKGTFDGTISDIDGSYQIEAPENSTIVYSYTGFNTQEILVDGQDRINVSMTEGVALDEVVVTALGISREKKALGYSVSSISSDDLKQSGKSNIVDALQGRVAGVQINSTSGAPGSGSDILIRGITSLDPGRSNTPLYIIDGIEISDDTDVLPIGPSSGSNAASGRTQAAVSNRAIDINPEDIESITVLKGAKATALYGIRAANGAIVIVTKKGQVGAPKINVHFGMGVENVNKVPTIQRKFRDGHRSSSKQRSFLWDTWGSVIKSGQGVDPTHDIYNEFFQTGHSSSYGASVSAGSEKITYRISADKVGHKGIIPNTSFDKINFSIASSAKLSDKFSIDGAVRFANSGGRKPHSGDKSILSDLSYLTTVVDPTTYETPYVFGNNFAVGIIDHPQYLVDNNSYTDNVNRYISSLALNYQLTDNISLKYTIGLDNSNDARTRIVHPETDEGSKVGGFIVEQGLNSNNVTSNLMANWQYRLNDDISFSGVIGNSIFSKKSKWVSTRGEKFAEPSFFNLNNATNFFQSNSEVNYRNVGAFAEVTTSYKDYLYLSLTGRNDWSSTLPKQNNSYFFPGASLAWVISDMVELPKSVSLLKLRGSYAIVGKDANPYRIDRLYGVASNFPFGSTVGFSQSSVIGDENLKPEFTKSLELGAELNFFNNRLGFDISYYTNSITDMILSVPISNATGGSRYYTNAGEIKTKGLEIFTFATPIKSNNFTWETSLNWSTHGGEVVKIKEGIENINLYGYRDINNRYVEGSNIGDFHGRAFERTQDGQLIIDENGYPNRVDTLSVVGNAFPDWIAGWNNSFNYKGIGLSFLWEWRNGGDVIDLGRRNSLRNGQLAESLRRNEVVIFEGVNVVRDDEGNITETKANTVPVELTGLSFFRSSNRYNSAADVLLEDA
ncbi:MAG: SusC/RagA family TonB-linked outer membrane protein, partial [Saprospiraceae bacterium]